jgi:hypothetical protein
VKSATGSKAVRRRDIEEWVEQGIPQAMPVGRLRPKLRNETDSMRPLNGDSHCIPRATTHPAWVSENLIQATLTVWQPYYDAPLTREDAIEMILAASRLLGALSRPQDA